MAYFVKLFLDTFDGQSADIDCLTPAQRWIWVALLAFARKHKPHGLLNVAENGRSAPAGLRRLADWCGVGKSTIADAVEKLLRLKMLHRDGREKEPMLEVSNWSKWQLENGKNDPSNGDGTGVREMDSGCPGDGQQPSGCPGDGQVCPGDGQERTGDGHLFDGIECPGGGQQPEEGNGDTASGGVHSDAVGVREMDSNSQSNRERLENDERRTAASTYQDLLQFCIRTLGEVNPQPHADVVASIQGTIGAYQDYAQLAALKTVEAFREKQAREWKQVANYFTATAGGMASDAKAQKEVDPALSQFEKLYGLNPRLAPGHEKQRKWNMALGSFRLDPLVFIYYHRDLQDKASQLGLWNHDADPKRAEDRIRQREAEEQLIPATVE